MKLLNEILDLYKLHQNPQELAKYKEAQTVLQQKAKWAYFYVSEDGDVLTWSGNSTLIQAKNRMVKDGAIEDSGIDFQWSDYGNVRPWNPKTVEGVLEVIDNQHYDPDGNDQFGIHAARDKFLRALSSMRPITVVDFGFEYSYGLAVFEHNPQSVHLTFGGDSEAYG